MDLFTFARDAERRFASLKMRIEERSHGARGDRLVVLDVSIAHPGRSRILTSEPALGTAGSYDIWVSDGETVHTYTSRHRSATARPVRPTPRGLHQPDLPPSSRVYEPITRLPANSLPDTFVHPAGYCQNVLATGQCRVVGEAQVAGRQAVLLDCETPRTTLLAGDRPDYRIEVAFDRVDGVITRLVESMGGLVTRRAEVVAYDTDVDLPAQTFDLAVPEGARILY
jgi:outer membrane lipoprotein-sorting protein